MKRLGPGAGEALTRALRADVERCGGHLAFAERTSRGWQARAQGGERHRLALTIEGGAAEAAAAAFLDGLEERNVPIPGHFLAEIMVLRETRAPGRVGIEIQAWTVEAD